VGRSARCPRLDQHFLPVCCSLSANEVPGCVPSQCTASWTLGQGRGPTRSCSIHSVCIFILASRVFSLSPPPFSLSLSLRQLCCTCTHLQIIFDSGMLYCPPIDSIVTLMSVWRITGKIIRTTGFRKDLCFTHDVFFYFFFRREISEMRGPTGVKFCTMVSTRPNFIMPVQDFGGGRTPKKFRGRKTCKIWPDFGRLRSSAANISETDEDIQNRIVIPCMAIPPALGETNPVKFGPVTLEI